MVTRQNDMCVGLFTNSFKQYILIPMAKYIIDGGTKLHGEVSISGNKNAVFPCLAAALLTSDEVTLKNVPDIADTRVSIEILIKLGVEVSFQAGILKLKAANLTTHTLPKELSKKLRGSILYVGGLLGRLGKAEFTHPGGDIIGKRTIQPHLDGFKALGFDCQIHDIDYVIARTNTPLEVEFFLEEAGVTATENLIVASVLGNARIILKNCAEEPHVVDVCNMLVHMGARISGIGSSTITIDGVECLHGTEFTLGSDFVEMGTYAIASAITNGEVKLLNCNLKNLEPITSHLSKMGVLLVDNGDNSVSVQCNEITAIPKLHTNIWPGFPTDLMSAVIVLATQANGVSLLHDWMYESRMFFVDKLIGMGANITVADPHRVVVYGPTKMVARELETPDIRAGMALVLAALIAEGKSTINKAELIERGYADVLANLKTLGVNLSRIE